MKKTLFLFLSVIAFSCSNKLAEEAEKIKKETFALHDEVMPATMALGDLKDEISKKVEKADSTLKSKAFAISSEISQADELMMTWMEKLGDADKIENLEEKIKKMTDLKSEGEKIKQLTADAKKKAEEFLK